MHHSPKLLKSFLKFSPQTILGLGLLCILVFFWRLDAYSLFNRTETETAEVARQMWGNGDWITPIFNGLPYFDKPILFYWLIGVGFRWLGINEWAVRLPSALFATALIFATWQFVRKQKGSQVALLVATMLIANPLFFALGRTGVSDMGLTFFITVGLYAWYSSYRSGKKLGYLACAALLGGGVLIKGPIALLLPVLIISIFLLYTGQFKTFITTMPWIPGGMLFSVVVLPWYVLVTQANGWLFINQFFIHHNVDRLLSVVDKQPGPWYYYLIFTPASFFPWITFLFIVLFHRGKWEWLHPKFWQLRTPTEQLPLFMSLWVVIMVVFLSTAFTKLPHYILPALPALAFLCAQAWDAEARQRSSRSRLGLIVISVIFAILGVVFLVLLKFIDEPRLDSAVGATGAPLIWSMTCFLAAFGNLLAAIHYQFQWAWRCSLGAVCIIFMTTINLIMPVLETQRYSPLRDMANMLHHELRLGMQPATLGVYAPSLNFYGKIDYLPVYWARDQIINQLSHSKGILLLTTEELLTQTQLNLSTFSPIHTAGPYRLYALPPGSVK